MVVCYVLAIGIYQFACPSQTDWLVSSVEGRVRETITRCVRCFHAYIYRCVLRREPDY